MKTISKAALLAILDQIEGDEIQFFPASVHYDGSDAEAFAVAKIGGIDQKGVFVKAA